MGFFNGVFNNNESALCMEYDKAFLCYAKLMLAKKEPEVLAAFVVNLFGFKEQTSNFSPNGEQAFLKIIRDKAMQALDFSMFDSTVNWIASAHVSHLRSREPWVIKHLSVLRKKTHQGLREFYEGGLDAYLAPLFAELTQEQRYNALTALGNWNTLKCLQCKRYETRISDEWRWCPICKWQMAHPVK